MHTDSIILKADFHLHTHEDPEDSHQIDYSAFDLMDTLEKKDFNVFSITLHNHIYDYKMMRKVKTYAKSKGLLYIPGIEKTIEKNHILIYNMRKEDAERIETYDNLKDILSEYSRDQKKHEDILVIAAHPFFPAVTAIGKKFDRHHGLFHGVEYNSFYLWFINFNIKGCRKAREKNKIIVGNTDAHILEQVGNTYTQIFIPKNLIHDKIKAYDTDQFKNFIKNCTEKEYDRMNSTVIEYIKKGKTKVVTRPLKIGYVAKSLIKLFR